MLDPKLYRENPDLVREGLRRRGAAFDLDGLLRLDREKRELGAGLERLQAERNKASESIARLKREGADASAAIAETRATGDRIKELQAKYDTVERAALDLALLCPNLPHASVPDGTSAADNRVAATWGEPATNRDVPDHLGIGAKLGLFDFERGAKISGSGFPVYTGAGARLERALINFFLDTHTQRFGFTEVSPPYLVTRETMTGTGQLPKFEEDMYRCEGEDGGNRDRDLFLVPTAEVPVTNLHAGEVLDEASLPISYCAYTACFRREAGSWGADTRGFLRLHQFNKVEMVKFASPDKSWEALEELRGHAEELLRMLELPYRVLELCAGDMGFGAAKCYDLEVWAPAEKKWLEVSSCSNFTDFQARRADIRCKAGGKPRFVHTLNGSGLATPRVLAAFLETHYTERGTVRIPAALRPWMGGLSEIGAG